ncbi:MAG: DUF58 domain-containing protein [Rhodothermaceae bacterium]|nr:DUF58 domain-containing protein [Rhodothermaceae bacterium]MXW32053.1 DUF58 domain-containing protein [Rhodothermaceae bacterium]MYC05202.1 DUF58 domain-containing protein [Rhodothermaceae bacterium]MYE63134.1 DUF58 domain-containing protein [Rhodothermaceae bacterium]MYI17181.1 DUF58 domain-containing protein [Rhodothermaceae bacterium]
MAQAATRFIQPDVLARISSLELLARSVVEGFIAGLHRSPFKGFSVDFMEYRPYVFGDDVRQVDWKVFARTGRYFVREFEGETNTRLHLLLDMSRSMDYSSGGQTKLTYARFLAAAIAWLANRQRDACGLALFDTEVRKHLPPRATRAHLHLLLRALEEANPDAATNLERSLQAVAERHRKRGFIVLISDLFTDINTIERALQHFRFTGHNVLVFQILDPQEIEFDFKDVVELLDVESDAKMLIDAKAARAQYQKNFQTHQNQLRRICGLLQIDHAVLRTDAPLDSALFHYLSARSRRRG